MKVKAAILGFLFLALSFNSKAFDFLVHNKAGDLYFKITSATDREVAVVSPTDGDATQSYGAYPQPTGNLEIPMEVRFRDVIYTVTAIDQRAFSGCAYLRSVTIPLTVRSIGAYAFYACTGLTGFVTIGENVEEIGSSAFYGCTFINGVYFKARDCRTMGGSMGATVFGNCKSLRTIRFSQTVRRIPDYAFCGLDCVSDSIILPDSLLSIGAYAFSYCTHLSGTVSIPNLVETIGEFAFNQCHGVKRLVIGSGVKSIGDRAFYHCAGLKRVALNPLRPPIISSTSFTDLPKTTQISVPCTSKEFYETAVLWNKLGPFRTHGRCYFSVTVDMNDEEAGHILGGGHYQYRDTARVAVLPSAGYGFDGWADGNTDNPRVFRVEGNVNITALMRPSGTMVVKDTVYRVDTLFSAGRQVIHDTVEITELALPINKTPEVVFDKKRKRLTWKFKRKREKVVSLAVYNQQGECVYTSTGRSGHVNTKRYPTGQYVVRVETSRRVIRSRFFMTHE